MRHSGELPTWPLPLAGKEWKGTYKNGGKAAGNPKALLLGPGAHHPTAVLQESREQPPAPPCPPSHSPRGLAPQQGSEDSSSRGERS